MSGGGEGWGGRVTHKLVRTLAHYYTTSIHYNVTDICLSTNLRTDMRFPRIRYDICNALYELRNVSFHKKHHSGRQACHIDDLLVLKKKLFPYFKALSFLSQYILMCY